MVLIYTGNEQLDKDLNKKIHNSRIVFYPDYILKEKQAKTLILAVQPDKFEFNEFIFKVREKDIQVILILENEKQKELKDALTLGIYDIVFDPFRLEDICEKIKNPTQFSKISKYIKTLVKGVM